MVVVVQEKGVEEKKVVFDSLMVLVAWNLWLERNACVFEGVSATAVSLVDRV
jgi:hypothetical protein